MLKDGRTVNGRKKKFFMRTTKMAEKYVIISLCSVCRARRKKEWTRQPYI